MKIHTMTIHNTIKRERILIFCEKFSIKVPIGDEQLTLRTSHIHGVNEVKIKLHAHRENYDIVPTYDIYLSLNVGQIVGESGVRMTEWNKHKQAIFFDRLKEIFEKCLFLEEEDPRNWYVFRLDYGVDIIISSKDPLSVAEYVMYIRELFKANAPSGFNFVTYKGYLTGETREQSLYIACIDKSYRYNIYDKEKAAINKKQSDRVISESEGVLRIERQVEDYSIVSRNQKGLSSLCDNQIITKLETDLAKDMKIILADENLSLEVFAESHGFLSVGFSKTPLQLFEENARKAKKRKHAHLATIGFDYDKSRKRGRYTIKLPIKDISGVERRISMKSRVGEGLFDFQFRIRDRYLDEMAKLLHSAKDINDQINIIREIWVRLKDFQSDVSEMTRENTALHSLLYDDQKRFIKMYFGLIGLRDLGCDVLDLNTILMYLIVKEVYHE